MSGFFSRLNPAERRFGIGVGMLFFVILNYFLIWPHFSDWTILKIRLNRARDQRANYENTIEQASKLRTELAKLKGEGGDVPPEDQALQFSRTIQNQANQSGIGGVNFGRQTSSTNSPFFLELSQTISIQQSGEKQLVDFLYNLSAGNSMVRVRSLSVHPDPPRQQLAGTITLMASYQKKSKTPATPAVVPKAAPAAAAAAPKPAVQSVAKPGFTNAPTPKK